MADYPGIAREINRRILNDPKARLKIIQEFYSEMVATGNGEVADFILTLRSIAVEDSKFQPPPAWILKAGFAIGLLTLVFFMAVVFASIFGHVIPDPSKFPVLIVFALGSALSASFLTGHAALSGRLPFFSDSPMVASATGGMAVLIIILLLGYGIYIK